MVFIWYNMHSCHYIPAQGRVPSWSKCTVSSVRVNSENVWRCGCMNHNHKLYCKNTTLAFRPQGRAVGVPAAYLQEAKEGGRWRVLAGARFSEHCAHCGSTNGYVVHRVDHQGKQCHNANCRDGAAPYQTAWFSLPDTLHSSVEMLHDIVFFY